MNDDGHPRFHTSLTPNTSAPDLMRDNFVSPNDYDPLMPGTAAPAGLPVTGAGEKLIHAQAAPCQEGPGGVWQVPASGFGKAPTA